MCVCVWEKKEWGVGEIKGGKKGRRGLVSWAKSGGTRKESIFAFLVPLMRGVQGGVTKEGIYEWMSGYSYGYERPGYILLPC